MKRRIGYLPTVSFESMSVEEICRVLNQIGYRAVEWTLFFASPDKPFKELEQLINTSAKYDLQISDILVQQDLILTDETERNANINLVKKCINTFSDLGIKAINVFTGPIPWLEKPLKIGGDISEGKAWDLLFKGVDEILPLAEEKGISLAFENVWGMLCNDFFTMKHLIDRYDSDYIGVNYDPSHDIVAGHTDIGFIVRNWGKKIKSVHLKDAECLGDKSKFIFTIPGEGSVDWKQFSAALDDAGYTGPMNVEFEAFSYAKKIFDNDYTKAARLAYDNFIKLL